MITHKIDFVGIVLAQNCNPNGDPTDENWPRIDEVGRGMMSDVCIKRKIRNRMQDLGHEILLKADDRSDDGFHSIKDRVKDSGIDKQHKFSSEGYFKAACDKWLDVRSFGQVFAFKGERDSGVTLGIRGPVTIQDARSIDYPFAYQEHVVKSINLEAGGKRESSTMGVKKKITKAVYIIKGSINCNLSEKTGFSDDDAKVIKECLLTLFENDESAARPAGSMIMCDLYWFEHDCGSGVCPSFKVFESLNITPTEEFPYYKVEERYELPKNKNGEPRIKCDHYNVFE